MTAATARASYFPSEGFLLRTLEWRLSPNCGHLGWRSVLPITGIRTGASFGITVDPTKTYRNGSVSGRLRYRLREGRKASVLAALWSVLSHPSTIVGRDGVGTLVVPAVIVALVTFGFMATVGRQVLGRCPVVAVLLGCAFVPLMMNALAFLAMSGSPDGTDGGGMLVLVALVLSICAVPVTLATSVLYAVIWRRRGAE